MAAASRTPLGDVHGITAAIGPFGEAAVAPLLTAIARNPNVVGRLGDALGALGPEAVDRLVAALEAADVPARVAIASGLGKIGDVRATPYLTRLLEDESERVRRDAAWGLLFLKDPAAIPALVAAVENDANTFPIRDSAARAARELGWTPRTRNQEIQLAVLDLNTIAKPFVRDPIGNVTRFGSEVVEPLLLAMETADDMVRRRIVDALGELRDERARVALSAVAAKKPENYDEIKLKEAAERALSKLDEGSPVVLASGIMGAKPAAPRDSRVLDRRGKCSNCASIVELKDAREVYLDWDGVDAWSYHCPSCFVEGDIYKGRLVDRFGNPIVDQYS